MVLNGNLKIKINGNNEYDDKNELEIMTSAINSIKEKLAYKLNKKYKDEKNVLNCNNIDGLIEVLFLLVKFEYYEVAEKFKNRIEFLGGNTYKKSNLERITKN